MRACIQALGFIPGAETKSNRQSTAAAISADGTTVVGTSTNADGLDEAFRWVNGGMIGLGKIPGATGICTSYSCSVGNGVSGDGSVVVGYGYINAGSPDPRIRAFRWSGGMMTQIVPSVCPQPDAVNDSDSAAAISADASTIVGSFFCYSSQTGKAYRYVNSTMTSLGDVAGASQGWSPSSVNSNGSVIAGTANVFGFGLKAISWTSGTIATLAALPGRPYATADAVTPDGSIVFGSSLDGNNGCCLAVRWSSVSDAQLLPGNPPRSASGNGVTAGGGRWTSRDGYHEIAPLLAAAGVNLAQWDQNYNFSVSSVSADGLTFAGSAIDLNGKTQAFIARLPLPAFHDFDADSRSDIVWRETSSGAIGMWLMNGAAVQQNIGLGSAPTSFSIVGQRDFNGDGKHDLLWRDTSGNIAMWLMNGGAIQTNANLGSVPTTWSVAGTGDFNGDGKGDILWRESTTGNIALWLMNGTAIQQNINVGSVPTSWSVAGVADFNGDGKADILWRDTSGTIAMWLMNAGAIQTNINLGTVPVSYTVAGTGDFNGDGKADLVWRESSSGNIAMWLMNGGAIQTNANLGSVPTSWSIPQTGDYNGDGKSDLVWRESSTGNIVMWLMNGTAIQTNANVGSVPTNWAIQGAGAD